MNGPISILASAALLAAMVLGTSCVTTPGGPETVEAFPPPESEPSATEDQARLSAVQESSPPPQIPKLPSPPKPSLSQLTDVNRPYLDFYGARIYADSIAGSEASGNVFLDGTHLHRVNRSFPIAVYAEQVSVDLGKSRITLSGWPIVQTDSAYVQAQSQDTVITLSRDRMARIKGPARYVIGSQEDELFLP